MEKRALVTGGAQGLGREVAELLRQKGFVVDVVDRLSVAVDAAEGCSFAWDLTNVDHLDALRLRLESTSYQVLVHAAGIGQTGSFDALRLEDDHDVVNLNVRATLCLTKWFVAMPDGVDVRTLILVSSMAGLTATPGMSVYAATKSFVSRLAESVDWELRLLGRRARVLAVAPPPLATRFRENNGRPRRSKSMSGVLSPACVAQDILRLLERPEQHRISGGIQRFVFRWIRPWLPERMKHEFVFRSALQD